MADLSRRMVFEHGKWDPQLEDTPALCPAPMVLDRGAWETLARAAEALYAEALAAESELVGRVDLHGRLGLPRAVRRALGRSAREGASEGLARVMRFDFHWAREGWKVSEANSDVPGGYIEASGLAALMSAHAGGARPAGDPGEALAAALRRGLGGPARLAMVHATAYSDDRQVMRHLAARLERDGARVVLVSPAHLRWRGGLARIEAEFCREGVDAIVRFFPAEWAAELPASCAWWHLYAGARTPQCNPATALLVQSKRFPLTWDALETPLPAWRSLLAETADPARVNGGLDAGWVLKPALGRVGEAVGMDGVTDPAEWAAIRRSARWRPRWWAAQRRFEAVPWATDLGPLYPCLGVFAVDGRAAGIYGRAARRPLIDHRAMDVAVLVGEGGP
ncbi:MAG: glutathionylspermidine synthase family protein [Planctomycetes bacterium]|nr:glutathionylspermidine synthase family protein [Planctomycetota bacterium]